MKNERKEKVNSAWYFLFLFYTSLCLTRKRKKGSSPVFIQNFYVHSTNNIYWLLSNMKKKSIFQSYFFYCWYKVSGNDMVEYARQDIFECIRSKKEQVYYTFKFVLYLRDKWWTQGVPSNNKFSSKSDSFSRIIHNYNLLCKMYYCSIQTSYMTRQNKIAIRKKKSFAFVWIEK